MNKDQLRELIVDTLKEANLYSESAVELLMLTAAVESNLGEYIKQINGPALGVFQMEPATEEDIHKNYLEYRTQWEEVVGQYMSHGNNLKANLEYQILMARIHYLRVPEALPSAKNVTELASYWKRHYNTRLGKGTVSKAIDAYYKYCV